jgi:hypothetical protein
MRPVGLSQIEGLGRDGKFLVIALRLTYDATMPGTFRSLK